MRLSKHRGKWSVRIDGRRFSTGVEYGKDTFEDAERKAREIIRSLTAQSYGNTVAEIIRAYKDDMPNRLDIVVNPERIEYAEKAIIPFFGKLFPKDVTVAECRAFVAKRRDEGLSDGTIRRELGVMRAALKWKDSNTPAQFDFPPPPPPRNRWLTRDEFQRLLIAAKPQMHVLAFLHIAIATGARKEAILGLRWDTHIDFEKRMIWLGFKESGKGRATVPMTNALVPVLRDVHANALTDWVIEWAGGPVKDIRKALSRTYERAGLGDVPAPAHTLRRTSGAWMAQAGVPMTEISRRLGHSSIAVTEKHYSPLHPDYMQQSTEALEV